MPLFPSAHRAKAAKTHAAFVAPAEQAIALQCLREHALLRQDLSAMESNIMDVRGSRHASTMVREKAKVSGLGSKQRAQVIWQQVVASCRVPLAAGS